MIDISDAIDEYFEEFPKHKTIAFARAARKYGLEIEWDGDAVVLPLDPEEMEAMCEDDAFMHLFGHEAKLMLIKDDIRHAVAEGVIVEAGVDESGEFMYAIGPNYPLDSEDDD